MATPAAIGFRAHSGWAAAVAVTIVGGVTAVIVRRRIEMGLAQPYHAAALESAEAERIVGSSVREAASMATAGLRTMIASLRDLDHEVVGCGLLLASGRPLPALESILASHALIHTAEGEHFRDAIRAAARACGLPLIEVKERDILTQAAAVVHHLPAMGKAIGPPWRQDEKYAALAGWLALSNARRLTE